MALLAIDLGGTKLASAVFHRDGTIIERDVVLLGDREGRDVGSLITAEISRLRQSASSQGDPVQSIGICIPGISNKKKGTAWVPNIAGWTDYPLQEEVSAAADGLPLTIESDRTGYILGEMWQGNAKGCTDAIYLSVGTGIGAGIVANGQVIRGKHDIAGAIGWMALNRPFWDEYIRCGCFEYHASGPGIANMAMKFLEVDVGYTGPLKPHPPESITSHHVFSAFKQNDPLAGNIIRECIAFWGMAVANLVSIFNPEKIILGGGVFGPAVPLIPAIKAEAARWAQPISEAQYTLEKSALGADAGLYGAGFLALENMKEITPTND